MIPTVKMPRTMRWGYHSTIAEMTACRKSFAPIQPSPKFSMAARITGLTSSPAPEAMLALVETMSSAPTTL